MYQSLVLTTPPAVEPVTVSLLQRHARIDSHQDDDLLQFYLTSARERAEAYLSRALITQTLTWTFSQQPPNGSLPLLPIPLLVLPILLSEPQIMNKPVELPRSPAQSISGITVTDCEGVTTALTAGTDYTADLSLEPARIKLHWLSTPSRLQNVQITFVAGYGDAGAAVPTSIQHAIMLLATYFYEQRGEVGGELPRQFRDLLTNYRLVYFGG